MTDFSKPLPSMVGIETLAGFFVAAVGTFGLILNWNSIGAGLIAVIPLIGIAEMLLPIARHYDAKKIAEQETMKKAQEEKLWEMYWQ